jgi:Fic family protein
MTNVYTNYKRPLTHKMLFSWNTMITKGRSDLEITGNYRKHQTPMQIVSGSINKPNVHFEAPPSIKVEEEMTKFIDWFNTTKLPCLTKASLTHLYFESIHPFEDGNGRIGRALVEKVISQTLGQPIIITLSDTIHRNRKTYYDMLESSTKTLAISDWVVYFSKTIIQSQKNTLEKKSTTDKRKSLIGFLKKG